MVLHSVRHGVCRWVAILLLLTTAACGKLAADVAEGGGRFVTKVVERLFQAGESRRAAAPVRNFGLNGDVVSGRLMTVGGRKLLVKDASPAVTRRAEALLDKEVVAPVNALSMMHHLGDRPTLGRVKAGWPTRRYTEGVYSDAGLRAFMNAHRGERVISFGHIEGGSPANAHFVAYHGRQSIRVSVARLMEMARAEQVQLTIVGCRSFHAGAPAGPYLNLEGRALPGILSAMRGAKTYGEFIAAIGTPDQPIIVDPAPFNGDVGTAILAYRILGVKKVAMTQSLRPAGDTVGDIAAIGSATAQAATRRFSLVDRVLILILFGLPFAIWGVLVPAGQMLRAAGHRWGDRIGASVAAAERRLRMSEDARWTIRFGLVGSVALIGFDQMHGTFGIAAALALAGAVILFNLAGNWVEHPKGEPDT